MVASEDVKIVGYTPNTAYRVAAGGVTVSLTVNTEGLEKALRSAGNGWVRLKLVTMSVKWKHSRARGESGRGRFRGVPHGWKRHGRLFGGTEW